MTNPWWQSGVIYQIYPRSFFDTNSDGIGDLKGVIEKLDYLNGKPDSLGVDVIWLSPFFPSPQDDFGYDITDYKDVDPCYGSMGDVKTLISECGKRNIKVMFDLVVNHTSSLHPWFIEARSSRDNPKRDWYIWADGKGKNPPNNWKSRFGGSSWEFDEQSGQYYLHSFLKSQPDLNWRNPKVRAAVLDIFKFWLELGVSGFRLDVFNFYFKDAKLRDNPRRLSLTGLLYDYARQQHIYDKDQPELYEAVKEIRTLVDSYGGVLLGEVDSDDNTKAAALCYGKNGDGLHLSFNFDFLLSPWKAKNFRRVIEEWNAAVPRHSWPTYVLSNHDQPRHFSRFGENVGRAKVAATLLLTLRGTPVLYYGEEIGMRESFIRPQFLQDPPGKRFWPLYVGRDGCRTPMQWNSGFHAGFSNAPQTWLPVDECYREVNVEQMAREKESLWKHYQKIIKLRREHSVLQTGGFEFFDCGNDNVLSYLRTQDNEKILVLLNFTEKKQRVKLLGSSWNVLEGLLTEGGGSHSLGGYGVVIAKHTKEKNQ